jgi:ribonuclease HI
MTYRYVVRRQRVNLYSICGHAGVKGNEISDRLARVGSAVRFVGPEPAVGSLGRI